MTYVNLYEAVRTIARTLPGGDELAPALTDGCIKRGAVAFLGHELVLIFQRAAGLLEQAIRDRAVNVTIVADGARRLIADDERSFRLELRDAMLVVPFGHSPQPPLRDLLICAEDLKRKVVDLVDPPRLGSTAHKQRAVDEQIARYGIAALDDMGPDEAARVIKDRVEKESGKQVTASPAMIRGRIAIAKRSAKIEAVPET
jgi:chloramphenicol 3-O-phosphotransferase